MFPAHLHILLIPDQVGTNYKFGCRPKGAFREGYGGMDRSVMGEGDANCRTLAGNYKSCICLFSVFSVHG